MLLPLRRQLFLSIATITKRGWLAPSLQETPDTKQLKEEILKQLEVLLSNANINVVCPKCSFLTGQREMGVILCRELVDVFSCASAPANLPWVYHNTVKQSLQVCSESYFNPQETHLQMFFVRGLSLLQEVLRQPEAEQSLPQVKSFTKQCLSLLESVFSWPFTQEGKTG